MADVIKFRCKSCEKKISVRADYAGKKAKCPGCKQPLRVPSPRPKRSSTGVPIAAGAAGDPGSSSAGAKSYSLADLAEMEANADAEIKELSHKGRPNNIAPRCTLEPTIQSLGISAHCLQLIGMAQNLHHQGPAQMLWGWPTHNLAPLCHQCVDGVAASSRVCRARRCGAVGELSQSSLPDAA